jgi:hypothetical protein
MKTSNRKLRNEVKVGAEATEVGGQEELGRIIDKFGVGGLVLRGIRGSFVENENWLVDLDPLDTCNLEIGKEFLVHEDELGKEGDGIEVCRRLSPRLAENQVRERTENDRPGLDTKSLCLFILGEGLVIEELEIGPLRELGYDIVVVRVEPNTRSDCSEIMRKARRKARRRAKRKAGEGQPTTSTFQMRGHQHLQLDDHGP